MKIQISLFLLLVSMQVLGQAVNETITLQLSQPPLLRINAGSDLNLSESGSAVVGQSMSVNGGTPEFTYIWHNDNNNEFFEKTPEVYQKGIYRVNVKDQNNCSAVDSLSVWDYGTGFKIHLSKPEVIVGMDKLNRMLQVELHEVQGSVLLSVITIDGRIIYFFSRSGIMKEFIHQVDLCNAENGIYLLCIQCNDRTTTRKLILK